MQVTVFFIKINEHFIILFLKKFIFTQKWQHYAFYSGVQKKNLMVVVLNKTQIYEKFTKKKRDTNSRKKEKGKERM